MSDVWNEEPGVAFEEVYRELEETVGRLEEGGLTLDELLGLFERGMKLARMCSSRLDAAELRVSQLVEQEDGE